MGAVGGHEVEDGGGVGGGVVTMVVDDQVRFWGWVAVGASSQPRVADRVRWGGLSAERWRLMCSRLKTKTVT
jgi:hypothetical protein